MSNIKDMIESLQGDLTSIDILAGFLGYRVGENPINPDSDWKMYFTDKADINDHAVMAVSPEPELDNETKTPQIRKLYQKVIELKDTFGASFAAEVAAFIGKNRVVFFPINNGNRDTRLDLNSETIKKDLYLRDLSYLKNDNIKVTTDDFGFGTNIDVSQDKAFRQELTEQFLYVVEFYRKKLSELITGSKLKNQLLDLLSDKAKFYAKNDDLNNLVQSDSYLSVLSTVVDTIILRQLMRRFLEGYYGPNSFEVDGIALGVGSGTLDEAIKETVNVAVNLGEEKDFKKMNRRENTIQQLDLFSDAFSQDELDHTSQVEPVTKSKKEQLEEITKKATKQFELAYDSDLFAGSIAQATNNVESQLTKQFPEFMAKLWVDTASGNFSFRYQDMPPESLEKQYEDSMSKNVQIKIDSKTKKPVVFYGDDKSEQKSKGAYYTDQRFVDYMINKTVEVEFDKRYKAIQEAIKTKDNQKIKAALDHLLDLKIADFTCGGGSFLRGAFLKLADQYKMLQSLCIPDELKKDYPMITAEDDGYLWEKYILENMIYGVDIDYKAIMITSLTLTLSSLQHRPKDTKLPQLIGRTLIHQNSLFNAVPYYRRKEVFAKYQKDIAKLRKLKKTDFDVFNKLRIDLQNKVIPESGDIAKDASFLHVEAIELNLPEVYFNEDGTLKKHGGMDIVVGNPPWEKWKTNSDEFFSQYDSNYRDLKNKQIKKKLEKELYQNLPEIKDKWKAEQGRVKDGSKYIRSNDTFHFQRWTVNGRKTSADLNLYKVAVERFIQLANETARFSILVPDSFATDNGSTGLRHLVIDNYNLSEFLSFINRKKVFSAVDERYKFAVLSFNNEDKSDTFKAFFYKLDLNNLNNEELKMTYPISFLKEMEPERFALVEAKSQREFDLFKKIRLKFLPLRETKLIKFNYDFHKTKEANKLLSNIENSKDFIAVYEGKSMNQFRIFPNKVVYKVERRSIEEKVGSLYKKYRIGLRAVASATNQRTLIATLLPPNVTSTQSLQTQRNVEQTPIEMQLFYLGFINSYPLDFILRQLISMAVNLIYLQQLPLPKMKEIKDYSNIVQISKELLKENKGYYTDLDKLVPGNDYTGKSHEELIAELNARVMLDFDLTRDEVITLMHTFESAKWKSFVEEETQRIIDVYDKLSAARK